MEEQSDCTSGVCPEASGETVSIYVDHNHPLLQLKRALPWEALGEIMTRHWRQAGKTPMAARAYPGMWPCTYPWWS